MDEQLGLRLWNVLHELESQLGIMSETLQQMNELGPKDWLSAVVTITAFILGHILATKIANKQAAQLELHRLEDKLKKRKACRKKLVRHVNIIDHQVNTISLNCRSYLVMPFERDWEGLIDDFEENIQKVANRQYLTDTCELEFEDNITELQDAIDGIFRSMLIRPIGLQDKIGSIVWVNALAENERNLGYARDNFVKILDEAILLEQQEIDRLKKFKNN